MSGYTVNGIQGHRFAVPAGAEVRVIGCDDWIAGPITFTVRRECFIRVRKVADCG